MIKFTSPVKYILRDLSGHYYSGMGSDGAPNITATRAHAKLVTQAQAHDILCRFWSMATTIHRETKALGLTFPLFVFLERDELATHPLRLSGDRVETVKGRVLAGRVLVREGRGDALVFRD